MKLLHQKQHIKAVILFIVFFSSLNLISQSVSYVSNSGSDANTGEENSPYKTIVYAISQSNENDTIHIIGTITENNISVDKSLTFRGDSPNSSIVQAQSGNPHDESPRIPLENNRIFRLTSASSTVNFENLTLRHGNLSSGQGAAIFCKCCCWFKYQ